MDYIGPFEGKIFINLNNTSKEGKWQFYARCGLGRDTEGGLSFKEGWQEYGMISSVLFSYFRLYAQVHYGYNESLNNYNVKTVNGALGWPLSARVGLSLDLGD
jgi:outer membrane phospholipase A